MARQMQLGGSYMHIERIISGMERDGYSIKDCGHKITAQKDDIRFFAYKKNGGIKDALSCIAYEYEEMKRINNT